MKRINIRIRSTATTTGRTVRVRTTVSGPRGSKTVYKTYRAK